VGRVESFSYPSYPSHPSYPPYNQRLITAPAPERVATLWRLEWNDERLLCSVYRGAAGLQLCVESPTGIIASERFALRPRAVSRMRALRDSLLRRGWRDSD
jgi:hypothetical protein